MLLHYCTCTLQAKASSDKLLAVPVIVQDNLKHLVAVIQTEVALKLHQFSKILTITTISALFVPTGNHILAAKQLVCYVRGEAVNQIETHFI